MPTLPYNSYLLRFWQNSPAEDGWCYSLEDPRTGARRGFTHLEDLILFLKQETSHLTRFTPPNHEPLVPQHDE